MVKLDKFGLINALCALQREGRECDISPALQFLGLSPARALAILDADGSPHPGTIAHSKWLHAKAAVMWFATETDPLSQ